MAALTLSLYVVAGLIGAATLVVLALRGFAAALDGLVRMLTRVLDSLGSLVEAYDRLRACIRGRRTDSMSPRL
jgi:hypothetical protein